MLVTVMTGCNLNTNDKTDSFVSSNQYTILDILGAKIKFKQGNPTNLWNCECSFGAGEIDTVFIISKNGVEMDEYDDDTSGVIFQTSDISVASESSLKNSYKKYYGLDIIVEKTNVGPFKRHVQGENSKYYFESYSLKYDGYFNDIDPIDDEPSDVYYSIELFIYKDNYDSKMIKNVIDEYHNIINTLEFIEK